MFGSQGWRKPESHVSLCFSGDPGFRAYIGLGFLGGFGCRDSGLGPVSRQHGGLRRLSHSKKLPISTLQTLNPSDCAVTLLLY